METDLALSSHFNFMFILMFVTCMLIPPLILLCTMRNTRIIQVSPDDFQRLLMRKSESVVFWQTDGSGGGYLFFSSVDGNQICTKSKQRLDFPDTCELILMKPTRSL